MSCVWITGNSGSGKTTLGRKMLAEAKGRAVLLDGDVMRWVWPGLGLDEAGRREQNMRVARLAVALMGQGFDVIVATICPYRDLRAQVQRMTDCKFIYLPGGKTGPDYPYEEE
jgi:adenylylsulfate kinase-like enzyme